MIFKNEQVAKLVKVSGLHPDSAGSYPALLSFSTSKVGKCLLMQLKT